MQIVASAVDESAKIDLNSAPETLLKGLIEKVGGADPEATARIVDAIHDWRDADDVRRPNGAEAADYKLAGLQQKPANAPFETVSELARVLGMTPAIYARVVGSLTVNSRQPGINATTASRDVLLALPNATPEAVDAYLTQRAEALAAKLPVPPFPPASGFGAGAVPVWRIRAEARVPDGVTFAREAVVRPSGDARRPLLTLSWQDGVTVPRPPRSRPTRPPDHKTADSPMAERELTLPAVLRALHDAARRLGVPGFWRWWGRQLDPLVPARAARGARAPAHAPGRRLRGRPRDALASARRRRPRRDVAGGEDRLTGDAAAVADAGRAALAPTARMAYGGPRRRAARRRACRRARCCARRWCCRRRSRRTCGRRSNTTSTGTRRSSPRNFTSTRSSIERDARAGPSASTGGRAPHQRRSRAQHVAGVGCDVVAVTPEPPAAAATSRLNLLPRRRARACRALAALAILAAARLLVVARAGGGRGADLAKARVRIATAHGDRPRRARRPPSPTRCAPSSRR